MDGLGDVGTNGRGGPEPLGGVDDNVLDLARSLERGSSGAQADRRAESVPSGETAFDTRDRKLLAKAWIHARQQRDRVFDNELFSDPAWDILLDLYVAHCDGARLPVTSVCVAANAPTTTALRWIATLERKQLISRIDDPRDSRRKLLGLTDEALAKMEEALDSAARSDRRLGLSRLSVADRSSL